MSFITLNNICALLIIATFFYFIATEKRKKYKFIGLNDNDFSASEKREGTKNKHQEKCREILESIFKQRFITIRPRWLKNPLTGRNLELDGYNPYVVTPLGKGLAMEYDGSQHSRYEPYFHKNGPKDFHYQVKKDSWKDMQCKRMGVLLIRIPHFVNYKDLEEYIVDKLNENKVAIPE